jgi:hypothetical protein
LPLTARAMAPFFGRAGGLESPFVALCAALGVIFIVGVLALPVEPGAARFAARTGTVFFVLGSRSEVSAKRETIESSRAVNRRIRELATSSFGSRKQQL